MNTNNQEKQINVVKYAIRFAVIFFLLVYCIRIILVFLPVLLNIDIDFEVETSAILASVIFVVHKFLKDNKRAPSQPEKWKLIWMSLVFYWLTTIMQHIIHLLISDNPISIGFIATVVAVILLSVIYGLVLYYFYGSYACKLAKHYKV